MQMPCPMCVRADTIGKSQIRQQMQEDLPSRMNASQIKALQDAIGPAWQTLSRRDYFAAQALNGMVGRGVDDNEAATDCARKAYLVADAMLSERAKS